MGFTWPSLNICNHNCPNIGCPPCPPPNQCPQCPVLKCPEIPAYPSLNQCQPMNCPSIPPCPPPNQCPPHPPWPAIPPCPPMPSIPTCENNQANYLLLTGFVFLSLAMAILLVILITKWLNNRRKKQGLRERWIEIIPQMLNREQRRPRNAGNSSLRLEQISEDMNYS